MGTHGQPPLRAVGRGVSMRDSSVRELCGWDTGQRADLPEGGTRLGSVASAGSHWRLAQSGPVRWSDSPEWAARRQLLQSWLSLAPRGLDTRPRPWPMVPGGAAACLPLPVETSFPWAGPFVTGGLHVPRVRVQRLSAMGTVPSSREERMELRVPAASGHGQAGARRLGGCRPSRSMGESLSGKRRSRTGLLQELAAEAQGHKQSPPSLAGAEGREGAGDEPQGTCAMSSHTPRAVRSINCPLSPDPCGDRWSTPPEASRTSTRRSVCSARTSSGPPPSGRWGSCGSSRAGAPSPTCAPARRGACGLRGLSTWSQGCAPPASREPRASRAHTRHVGCPTLPCCPEGAGNDSARRQAWAASPCSRMEVTEMVIGLSPPHFSQAVIKCSLELCRGEV